MSKNIWHTLMQRIRHIIKKHDYTSKKVQKALQRDDVSDIFREKTSRFSSTELSRFLTLLDLEGEVFTHGRIDLRPGDTVFHYVDENAKVAGMSVNNIVYTEATENTTVQKVFIAVTHCSIMLNMNAWPRKD